MYVVESGAQALIIYIIGKTNAKYKYKKDWGFFLETS